MGGKSKSSSSTTNQNLNYDERIGASDNAVVFSNNVDGDNNTVTDYGAITEAFGFANNVVENANKTTNKAFDYSQQVTHEAIEFAENSSNKAYKSMETAFGFAKESQAKSFQALNDNTRQAFQFANDATVSADERVVNKLLPLLIIGGVVLALAIIMKGKK